MKIKDIRAVAVDISPDQKTEPRVPKLPTDGFISPMARYPEFKRSEWNTGWTRAACVVTAHDGTWGVGFTINSGRCSVLSTIILPLCSKGKIAWRLKSYGT